VPRPTAAPFLPPVFERGGAGLNGSVGEWAWGGMLGTFFMIDPEEDPAALYFSQILSDYNNDLKRGFIQRVYAAIDD
jgi:CubicO group peptidase (beta-lactamase class C family)